VIASNSGEIPHVVGDAGLLVGERDVDAWSNTIARALSDRTLRHDLAQRGRRRAESTFDWPIVARQHSQFFQQLIEGSIS
jgi:glycosyltransferase involved in cell wall biosynthesis